MHHAPTFSVLIPFFNEEEFLGATLESWAQQTRLPEQIILIDNNSTDQSLVIAKQFAASQQGRIQVLVLSESRPGKVFALEQGQTQTIGQWGVFCDADTVYPPQYLQIANDVASQAHPDLVAIMGTDLYDPAESTAAQKDIQRVTWASRLFPRKCHTGGYAQIFRMDALLSIGGFNAQQWPYVLMDHEIVHRLHKVGHSVYPPQLWCWPSPRRADRTKVRWTKWERFLYFVHPYKTCGDWFWYTYLGSKFKARGLGHANLRVKTWQTPADPS